MLTILPLLIDNSMHLYNAFTETERELKINWFVYINFKSECLATDVELKVISAFRSTSTRL